MGLMGMVLAVIQMIISVFIISFAASYNLWVSELLVPSQYYTPPQYLSGLLGATTSLALFGGIYVLVHSIKRIVDHGFQAYLGTEK